MEFINILHCFFFLPIKLIMGFCFNLRANQSYRSVDESSNAGEEDGISSDISA